MGKKSSLQSLLWKHQERSQADDRRRKTLDQRAAALKNRLKGKKRQIKNDSKDSGLDFHGKSIPNPDGRTAVAAEVLPPTWKLPFQMDDRILLLGEGNFSYALSLVDHHNLPPYNVMATTIDSEEECYRKYPEDAKSKVQSLREAGAQVLFEIDATKLHKYKAMRRSEQNGWNKVVFNFPHVGAGIKDQDRNILSNQTMLLGFLRSVAPLLSRGASPISRKRPAASDDDSDDERKPGGAPQPPEPEAEGMDGWSDDEDFQGIPDDERPQEETVYTIPSPPRQGIVLVTLRESKPYSLWNLPGLAKRPPPSDDPRVSPPPEYTVVRSYRFWPEAYPGYEHRRTKGEGGPKEPAEVGMGGTGGTCKTWEFVLRAKDRERQGKPRKKPKQRKE